VRSLARVSELLALGVSRVVMGTAALEDPGLLREAARRNPGCIVLGLDAREGCVAVRGWLETSARRVEEVLGEFADLPLGAILHTDIARDGMLSGPNLEATAALARRTSIPVIASGGVGSLADLLALARTRVIAGAIVGRALYEGKLELRAALDAVAAC
jgi:phosphoribosylformimino-5-aminoimidazole carboxamide ribotide isomerase